MGIPMLSKMSIYCSSIILLFMLNVGLTDRANTVSIGMSFFVEHVTSFIVQVILCRWLQNLKSTLQLVAHMGENVCRKKGMHMRIRLL